MTAFPDYTVMAGFRLAEQMLHNVLEVLPYCPNHENVWSPQLATVLLEIGSQLDSLWMEMLARSGMRVVEEGIMGYFLHIGKDFARRWVVFWADEPNIIQPFAEWDLSQHRLSDYIPLPWWQAYNKVKHNRLEHREKATLNNAVTALAGLFLAIVHCPQMAEAMAQEQWVMIDQAHWQTAGQILSEAIFAEKMVAEYKRFSSPIQAGTGKQCHLYLPNASRRFAQWCRDTKLETW
jgi:hypothetical protein